MNKINYPETLSYDKIILSIESSLIRRFENRLYSYIKEMCCFDIVVQHDPVNSVLVYPSNGLAFDIESSY